MKITTTAFIFYKGKLLLVFHKKSQRWMHVGGHVEEGESLNDALIREIHEETGLKVKVIDNSKKVPEELLPEVNNQELPFYVHSWLKGKDFYNALDYVCVAESDGVALKKDELLDFKWISRKELESADVTPYFRELARMAFDFYENNK